MGASWRGSTKCADWWTDGWWVRGLIVTDEILDNQFKRPPFLLVVFAGFLAILPMFFLIPVFEQVLFKIVRASPEPSLEQEASTLFLVVSATLSSFVSLNSLVQTYGLGVWAPLSVLVFGPTVLIVALWRGKLVQTWWRVMIVALAVGSAMSAAYIVYQQYLFDTVYLVFSPALLACVHAIIFWLVLRSFFLRRSKPIEDTFS